MSASVTDRSSVRVVRPFSRNYNPWSQELLFGVLAPTKQATHCFCTEGQYGRATHVNILPTRCVIHLRRRCRRKAIWLARSRIMVPLALQRHRTTVCTSDGFTNEVVLFNCGLFFSKLGVRPAYAACPVSWLCSHIGIS